ncbi:MAG TPA: radical SAM protein [Blastocatellia bacterium]|nr:radical SAM protein [Blastocatellia bacterium]
MKASNYVIYVQLPDTDDYYLIHGYSGAVDKVTPEVVRFLLDRSDPALTWQTRDQEIVRQSLESRHLGEVLPESVELLKQRGYLTEMSTEQERRYVERLAGFLHAKNLTGKPPAFMIVPIYDCNLRCPYCFENDARVQLSKLAILKNVMTEAMADAAYDSMDILLRRRFPDRAEEDLKKLRRSITLYGGEPLMKETLPIIEYIVEKGVGKGYGFGAITNGVDLHHFVHLLGGKKITFLQITLDGPIDVHDRKRIGPRHKNGTYDKILENVKAVLEQTNVRISVRLHVDWNTIDRSKEVVEDLTRRGLFEHKNFGIYGYPVHEFRKGDKPVPPLMAPYEVHKSFDRNPPSLNGSSKMAAPDDGIPPKLKQYMERSLLGIYKAVEPCAATTGMYIFDPLGRIYSCWDTVGVAGLEVGAYSQAGPTLNELGATWLRRSPQQIDECRNCKYAFFHFGGCSTLPLAYKGTIMAPACYEYQENFIYVAGKFFKQGLHNAVKTQQAPLDEEEQTPEQDARFVSEVQA